MTTDLIDKTILAHVGGFTPIIDSLAEELGHTTAAVFGRVWRFCQMKDGVCNASLDAIGKPLKMSKPTVKRHINRLIEHGYLVDLTPDQTARHPHIYADTGKAGLSVVIEAGVSKFNSDEGAVSKLNTTVSEFNSGVSKLNTAVSKLSPKIDIDSSKKDSKRLTTPQAASSETPPENEDSSLGNPTQADENGHTKYGGEPDRAKTRRRDPMFDAICKVCGIDSSIKGNGAKVGKTQRELENASPPYTPDEVYQFGRMWNADPVRRRKGPPTVWQLLERIGTIRHVNGSGAAVKGEIPNDTYHTDGRNRTTENETHARELSARLDEWRKQHPELLGVQRPGVGAR